MLSLDSIGSDRLKDFILKRGLFVWFLNRNMLVRALELVVAAEELSTPKIFTLDRSDFETYRVKRGHRHIPFDIVS